MSKQAELILKDNTPISFERFDEIFNELMRREWIVDDVRYNLSEMGWKWGYSSAKRALGTSIFNKTLNRGEIVISKPLLLLNLEQPMKFEDTIRHEIAHAIDSLRRGYSNHDNNWKRIAILLGSNGQRTTRGAIQSVGKFKWTGVCKNGHEVNRHRLNKAVRTHACSKCCNKFNQGKYSSEYILEWTKNF